MLSSSLARMKKGLYRALGITALKRCAGSFRHWFGKWDGEWEGLLYSYPDDERSQLRPETCTLRNRRAGDLPGCHPHEYLQRSEP